MKFIKHILVGGLLLTALGQSTYAATTLQDDLALLKSHMSSTALNADVQAAWGRVSAAYGSGKSSLVSAEQQAVGYVKGFSFGGYMPSSLTGNSLVVSGRSYAASWVDWASSFSKSIADFIRPAAPAQ